jgi:TP901 family phage tail tape measure protein
LEEVSNIDVFDLCAKISLDSSEYESGLSNASGNTESFMGKLGSGLATAAKVGVGALTAATTAVVAFSTESVNTGKEFDTSMSQVAATMGTTVDDIQELRDYALDMGASTAFSATQAADALNYMALAGYDADTSMEMLPNVLNLAAAGGMDLATASDMVTDAQSALGLTLDETTEMVDKMAKASSKSNTSVEQLGEAFLSIGGTAQELSGGTTELSTALGILADNGIKGAEGGTHLRNIILSLEAPTDTAAAAMEALGLQVFDAEGNMRPMNDILNDMNDKMSDMTSEEKTNIISTIFNKTDIASVNALLSNSGDRWDELSGYIDNAWLSMDSFDEQLAGFGTSSEEMQKNLEKLGVSSDEFTAALEGSNGSAGDFIYALRNAVDEGVTYSDITDAMGVSLIDLKTAFDDTAGSADAMADTQLDNLAGDITLFQSALEGAQIVVSDKLTPTLREFVQFGTDAISTLSEAFQEGGLSGAMDALGGILSDGLAMVIEELPAMVDAGMQLLTSLVSGIVQNIPTLMTAAGEIVTTLISSLQENLPGLLASGGAAISQVVSGIQEALPSVLDTGLEILTNIMDGIATGLPDLFAQWTTIETDLISTILDYLPDFVMAGLDAIGSMADGILNNLPTILASITTIINKLVTTIGNNLPKFLSKGLEIIGKIASGILNNLPTIISSITSILSNLLSTIVSNLPQFLSKGIEIIGKLAAGLIQAIPNVVASIPQIVQSIISGFTSINWGEVGSNIISGIANGIKNGVTAIANAAKEAAKSALNAAKSFLGIKSPSRVFRDQVGAMVSQGMALGIDENADEAVNSVVSMGNAVVSAAQDAADDLGTVDLATDWAGSATRSYTSAGTTTESVLAGLLTEILAELKKGGNVYIGKKALVGAIAGEMDTALGQLAIVGGRTS